MWFTQETLAGTADVSFFAHVRTLRNMGSRSLSSLFRYLCEFAYYCSLYHGQRRAALVHVPSRGGLSSADRLVPLLQSLIQTMLEQLEDPVWGRSSGNTTQGEKNLSGELNHTNNRTSHSFIYSKFQEKKKKKKIQEILRYTFGDGVSKIHHLSYRCEKTLRPQIQSLRKRQSLVKVFIIFFCCCFFFCLLLIISFPNQVMNTEIFCESIYNKKKIIAVDQGPLRRYRNAKKKKK